MIALLLAATLMGGMPADDAFQSWFEAEGVQVRIVRVTDGLPWVRGTTEINAPAADVVKIVTDFPAYTAIFAPHLERADVLETQEDGARLHMVWGFPFPLSDRDAVVRYRVSAADGVTLIRWGREDKPGDPKKGVRIDRVEGETRIEPLAGNRCRVRYTYLGDLGGKFPKKISEKGWHDEPLSYFQSLKKRLR